MSSGGIQETEWSFGVSQREFFVVAERLLGVEALVSWLHLRPFLVVVAGSYLQSLTRTVAQFYRLMAHPQIESSCALYAIDDVQLQVLYEHRPGSEMPSDDSHIDIFQG